MQAYGRFIDERVLWIRSAPELRWGDVVSEASGLKAWFSTNGLRGFLDVIRNDMQTSSLLWVSALLVIALVFGTRKRHLTKLAKAGEEAVKGSCRTIVPTVKALWYTVCAPLALPLVLGMIGWRLHEGVGTLGVAPWLFGWAAAFTAAAINLFILSFWRLMCDSEGMAVKHFDLMPNKGKLLHGELTWLRWVAVPISFVVAGLGAVGEGSEGRLCFIVGMVVLAVFVVRVLRPRCSILQPKSQTATRSSYLGFWIGLMIPLMLGIGAMLGYYYTVVELEWRVASSLWLILGVVVGAAFVRRWLLVARRRLAMQQAKKRRAALAAANEAKKGAEIVSADSLVPTAAELEHEQVDITQVKEQTERLIRSTAVVVLVLGLWGIWGQVLPALSFLEKVQLWDTTAVTSASNSGSLGIPGLDQGATGGETATASQVGKSSITLEDLASALLTLLLTLVAARNIPGLLEVTLLQRLSLKPGGSYAITTTARYVIVLIGIVLAFGMVGITWGKVHWIAAAVTVGIGFGLQEVIANFVAGLILLFERPIRLGDYITIANVSGVVTDIPIRATTIRDFSNRELIVPNKEFITGQLVNWTLSDPVIRLEIPVGIAYGANTELAKELLEKVGDENPHILKEPPPTALFRGFGASSLDFELRVHIRGAEDMAVAQSQLHFRIDQEFRKAGIEIAFPQTDIHIRSLPPEMPLPRTAEVTE